MRDIACVLLNYNSGQLCASAVDSLRAQRFLGRDGQPGTLQLIVVDNASPEDQRAALEPLRDLDVELIYNDQNDGYAGGINLGAARADAEFLLIANPDILVLEGALSALLEVLRGDPRVGCVGPRGSLDWSRSILLPPNDLPTLSMHVWESIGRVHRSVARRLALQRSRRYLRAWRATEAFEIDMVSGYAMCLPTRLARRLGPFDPHYPFYFEDADLCRRVRRAGYKVMIEPRAEVVHFFDQSARSAREEVNRKYDISRTYYYRKHYGRTGSWLFERMNRYVSAADGHLPERHIEGVEDLGAQTEPLELLLGEHRGPFVMELATDPTYLFCGGHLGEGDRLTLTESAWGALDTTRWFLRVLDAEDLSLLRTVTFDKAVAALPPISFDAYQEQVGASGVGA